MKRLLCLQALMRGVLSWVFMASTVAPACSSSWHNSGRWIRGANRWRGLEKRRFYSHFDCMTPWRNSNPWQVYCIHQDIHATQYTSICMCLFSKHAILWSLTLQVFPLPKYCKPWAQGVTKDPYNTHTPIYIPLYIYHSSYLLLSVYCAFGSAPSSSKNFTVSTTSVLQNSIQNNYNGHERVAISSAVQRGNLYDWWSHAIVLSPVVC